jgi:putative sterol carrier protein
MAEKLKNMFEEGVKKSPAELKDALPGMLESVKEAKLEDATEAISALGGINGILGKIGGVDEINARGKELKDVIPTLIPTINEIVQANIKGNEDLAAAFAKVKSAKVTAGMDLVDMGIGIKTKFDAGSFSIENGLEGADLTLVLPTAQLLEMPEMMSGGMSAMMKAFTGGKIKIKGAMMKGAGLMPLFGALGNIGKK